MTRSKWKGPHVSSVLLDNRNEIYTTFRNSEIIPTFVGKTFYVHNGQKYTKLLITEKMIGHKLGEFSFSRKPYSFKKK